LFWPWPYFLWARKAIRMFANSAAVPKLPKILL